MQTIFHPLLSEFCANLWNFDWCPRFISFTIYFSNAHTNGDTAFCACHYIIIYSISLFWWLIVFLHAKKSVKTCSQEEDIEIPAQGFASLVKYSETLLHSWKQCPCVRARLCSPLHTITRSIFCFSVSWSGCFPWYFSRTLISLKCCLT